MATKITFTGDVTNISTASNTDGSIRWHVYSRTVAGVPKVYVQREVSGVLEAEVLIMQEGDQPEIYWDSSLSQFLLGYRLNEKTWWVRIDEATVPATQAAQTDTVIDQFGTGPSGAQRSPGEPMFHYQTPFFAEAAPGAFVSRGPRAVNAIGIGPAPAPGMFEVRWRAATSTDTNLNAESRLDPPRFFIAGFNIYRRRLDNGAVERVNPTLIPFEGLDPHVYVYTTTGVAGTYWVVQVNRRGPEAAADALVEGQIVGSPQNLVRTDGDELPDILHSISRSHLGEGLRSEDLVFIFVDRAPLIVVQVDFLNSHLGEGFLDTESLLTYQVIQTTDFGETFPSHLGEGFVSRIAQTGFGSVVVG